MNTRAIIRLTAVAAAALAVAVTAALLATPALSQPSAQKSVRVWTIGYRAFDGRNHSAYVVLPSWYGPHRNPPIPLVISPHGRGIEPQANAGLWGNLPALGSFAVVNPEGQGTRLELYSWGAPGNIADLARMPGIVTQALPWLRIAPHRIYAVGSSMGGQETLLLLAQHPHLLAGAAALDSATNMAGRYTAFAKLPNGATLRQLTRLELGGVPLRQSDTYADRSPISYARQIARSGVPLQIWWSTHDAIVLNQAGQSGLLYHRIMQLNPNAPVTQVVGTWAHSADMHATTGLPDVLARLGLLR
jgi:poly(3-hydroxybutyrate) depolymerase